MNYAILRTKKLKEWGSICASLEHNFRERLTLNADENRTAQNIHIGGSSTADVRKKIEDGLPQKYRADCVKCIEYLITASPEWFKGRTDEQHQAYFDNAIEWLKERHGEDNIKCISIHKDESTPHLVAYVVPLDERGKLNAKKWLGGKKLLSEMQDEFAERSSKFLMLRGIKGSKVKHQRVQRFYGDLNAPQPKISYDDIRQKVVKKGLFSDEYEPIENVAKRVNEHIEKSLERKRAEIHYLKREIQSLRFDVESEKRQGNVKNYTLMRQNNDLKRELDEYKQNHRLNTKGLSTAQLDALNVQIESEREKNRLEWQKRQSKGGLKI
ncbi:TPA: plasmid recombination protein [Pasteurella multocida]|nr:plasmid recombination protein [Pasteurella multocida]